jgi:hypothetical protein
MFDTILDGLASKFQSLMKINRKRAELTKALNSTPTSHRFDYASQISMRAVQRAALDIHTEKSVRHSFAEELLKADNFYPPANPHHTLDTHIRTCFVLGKAALVDNQAGKRTKRKIRALITQSKKYSQPIYPYFDTLKERATRSPNIGTERFRLLCELGYPQATDEYMYATFMEPHVPATVVNKSKKALSDMGY